MSFFHLLDHRLELGEEEGTVADPTVGPVDDHRREESLWNLRFGIVESGDQNGRVFREVRSACVSSGKRARQIRKRYGPEVADPEEI
jgi:hypothetical protein